MVTQLFSGDLSTIDRFSCNPTRKPTLLAVLLLSLFAASARADVLYSFGFTPTTTVEGSMIDAFTFSFTVPTFVTNGQSPAFTPFTITDGVNQATLTEDVAQVEGGIGCFMFQTSTDASFNSDCSNSWGPPDGGEALFEFGSSIPTANGSYNTTFADVSLYFGSSLDLTEGEVSLVVSPEPTAAILLLTTLLLVAFVARKRIAQGL